LPGASSFDAREILRASWPLFQVCLPVCLPLAVLGVAASGVPGAETVARGEPRGLVHSGEWWGLAIASNVLMLICYAAILRQQLARVQGVHERVVDSLRQSVLQLPAALMVLLAVVASLGTLFLAWPALVAGANIATSINWAGQRLRVQPVAVLGVWGATIAAILVFVLLSGILLGVVLSLAGISAASTQAGLTLSRLLMAVLIAAPLLYGSAVAVIAWQASRTFAVPRPIV
jgi:hypothetical protein